MDECVVVARMVLASSCSQLKQAAPGVQSDSWESLDNALDQVKTVLALSPVPAHWIEAPEEAANLYRDYEALATDLDKKRSDLTETFVESIVDSVDETFALRFRIDYQGVFRSARPQYWRDMRLLRGHLARAPQAYVRRGPPCGVIHPYLHVIRVSQGPSTFRPAGYAGSQS